MGLAEEWGIKAIAFDIDGTLYPKRQMLFRLFLSSLPCIPFALRYNTVRRRIRKEDGTGGAGGHSSVKRTDSSVEDGRRAFHL